MPSASFQPGELVEVFSRMPFGHDNGLERLDSSGDRWLLCPTAKLGTNRPRIGWTERWLPATVIEAPTPGATGSQATVRFHWDVRLWFDWASGERIGSVNDASAFLDQAPVGRVRPRSANAWNLPSQSSTVSPPLPCGSEMNVGGRSVAVSFIVFRWGAAKIPVQYDSHSWGRAEGSTVSARFMQLFFNGAVGPRLDRDYETLSVFIQHSDEFAGISPEFLASMCRGRTIVALYFLWPILGQQTYGDKLPCMAAYVDSVPFFDMVTRMEACGIVTRWPHHSQLWRLLSSKDWVNTMCVAPKYHVPLTTRVPKSLILVDPLKAAQHALTTMRQLQAERLTDGYAYPANSDWRPGSAEQCVAKLGFSYEGVDVRMVQGEEQLAAALLSLATQAGYTNDCVHVQQRVHKIDLEARCFVVGGQVIETLYTRFARIDSGGYVRDYEKADTEAEAVEEWFYNDHAAWANALEQIRALTRRWHLWMLTQAAEPTVSVRIDYMIERVAPGKADVWTGEIGEQGYSMGGIDPVLVFNAVLDTISPEVRQRQPQRAAARRAAEAAGSGNGRGGGYGGTQGSSQGGGTHSNVASAVAAAAAPASPDTRDTREPSSKRPLSSSSSLQG